MSDGRQDGYIYYKVISESSAQVSKIVFMTFTLFLHGKVQAYMALKISFGRIWCDFSTHSSLYETKFYGKKKTSLSLDN